MNSSKRAVLSLSYVTGLLTFALPALGGYTTIFTTPEPGHAALLDGIYGGTFVATGAPLPNGFSTQYSNGVTTATRVDDDGFVALLNMLTGAPGTADDDVWTDGSTTASVEARFAGFPQEFGYDDGLGFVKMFEVTGTGFAATGSGMVTFTPGSTWVWARANDSDVSLTNVHYSDPLMNSDLLDHMVTYEIIGAPGIPPTYKVWALFWEDLNGPLGDNTHPANQGLAADRDFNDLVIQIEVRGCFVDGDCDDDNECTEDSCVNGFCENVLIICDDKNECTDDFCDPVLGCQTADIDCDDNDACTIDDCNPASGCFYDPVVCDDGVDCTVDTCDSMIGCVYTPDDAACDDGNECTIDTCDPVLGCVYQDALAGTPCGNQTPQGVCDQPDVCDGFGNCVANPVPAGIECRAAAGDCDVAEFCDGVNPDCPPDVFLPDTTECRASAGVCDVAEFCTGNSADCPSDGFEPNTTECRASAGVCDIAEFCTGNDADCPPDAVEPNTTECRMAAGVCDIAEFCDGVGVDCPADGFEPDTTECRAAAGVCDVAEFCTGSDADCPPDALEPDTTVCRPAVDECDVDEFCTGADVDCPANGFAAAGADCTDDGDECTNDICDGSGNCTHPDNQLCGACCLADKSCIVDVLEGTCTNLGGSHLGPGSICLGDSDGDGVDDQCDNCPGVDDATFGILVCCDTASHCESDADCGPGGQCIPACQCPGEIPTMSQWGMLILALLLMVAGKMYFGRREEVAL